MSSRVVPTYVVRSVTRQGHPSPGGTEVEQATEIGRRIAAARRAKGMSQEELADAVGVRAGIVSRWETGKNIPRIQRLGEIAEKLGQDVGYFTAQLDGPAPANGDGQALEAIRREVGELRELVERALADREQQAP